MYARVYQKQTNKQTEPDKQNTPERHTFNQTTTTNMGISRILICFRAYRGTSPPLMRYSPSYLSCLFPYFMSHSPLLMHCSFIPSNSSKVKRIGRRIHITAHSPSFCFPTLDLEIRSRDLRAPFLPPFLRSSSLSRALGKFCASRMLAHFIK